MDRTDRKNKRLTERVQKLKSELEQVEDGIRLLNKAVAKQDAEVLSRFRVSPGPSPAASDRSAQRLVSAAAAAPESPNGGAAADAAGSRAGMDPRLASYLMTGSFHSVHPLRQERRIQRNKAIVMVVIAGLLLYGVVMLILR